MENQNFVDVQPKEECKQCKKKPINAFFGERWYIFVLSFWLLFSSVYGTIKLFKLFFSLF